MLTMRVGVKPHLGCMQRWLEAGTRTMLHINFAPYSPNF